MASPREIATWRFEQIAPLLDASLSPANKRRVMRERCCRAVVWPNGKKKRIPRSTMYRWMRAYVAGGYLALMPAPRSDKGKSRRDVGSFVDYAIALLLEQPKRSLFQLDAYLKMEFEEYDLGRTTLWRHLKTHPAYGLIEKLRGGARKLRGRYEAKYPHESWQLDGKGPFRVRLMTGERVSIVVLSILDDYSRAVLATVVANSECTVAAVSVFQKAAECYGLPDRMQFDRGSAFDSDAFRHGLALAGVHRNAVRAKNPQAQGKIEAYHKALGRWFIDELPVQQVRDLDHLQDLLDAAIALLYQKHKHRGIRSSPNERLTGCVSSRRISERDLLRAFLVEVVKKSDRVTGEVILDNGSFQVPLAFAGRRQTFRYSPVNEYAILVTGDRQEIELAPFVVRPLPKPRVDPTQDRPQGQ